MAAIPWWVWLGVGLLVTISSVLIGGHLQFFAWVGVVFLIVAIAKVVFLFVFSVPKEEIKHKVNPQQQAFFCPRCRSQIHMHDFFCRTCGSRLR